MNPLNLPDLPPVPQYPVDLGAQPPIKAGASSIFNPHADMIDLDATADDPTKALISEVEKKTGKSIKDLGNFKLEKGFRGPDDNPNAPIPIYPYSNPPGAECYCFIRYWTVKYDTPSGVEEIRFKKTIYTNVEIPKNFHGDAHKQKQYLAAIAARTYAKVEESRITYAATGKKNHIYEAIESDISKIAHDRFVKLELFQGKERLLINPKNPKEFDNYKDLVVTAVRLNIRAGRREYGADFKGDPSLIESETDKHPLIPIAEKVASREIKPEDLKEKKYEFTPLPNTPPSEHTRKLHVLLKRDEILEEVTKNDRLPKEILKEAGVTEAEFKAVIEGEMHAKSERFNSELELLTNSNTINTHLMALYGGKQILSTTLLEKITPKKEASILEKVFPSQKKPKDLDLLTNIAKLDANSLTPNEKTELQSLVNACKEVQKKLTTLAKERLAKEQELDSLNIKTDRTITDQQSVYLTAIEKTFGTLSAMQDFQMQDEDISSEDPDIKFH